MSLKFLIALKYFKHNKSSKITCIGIALGVIALLVIMSIMNGLQTFQINALRNVESFDIVIDNPSYNFEKYNEAEGVSEVFPFSDRLALLSGDNIIRVRFIDYRYFDSERTKESMNSIITDRDKAIASLYNSDTLDLVFVSGLNELHTETGGFFYSELSEFNTSTIFMPLDDEEYRLGIFVDGNVDKAAENIKNFDSQCIITTYKDANSTLLNALFLEKFLVYIILSLMFVIISVNIKTATKRSVNNKMKESSVLISMGVRNQDIRCAYVIQGFLTSIIGVLIGIVVSDLLINRLSLTFDFVDKISQSQILFIVLLNILLSLIFSLSGSKKVKQIKVMEIIKDVSC